MRLLEGMYFDASTEYDRLELFVDTIQHSAIHLRRPQYLLIRVLQREASQIRGDLAPSSARTPPVRRSKEDNKLCTVAD